MANSKRAAAARVKASRISANARVATSSPTTVTGKAPSASSKRQALNQAIKIVTAEGGTKTTSQSPSGYKATIQASTSSGKPNPLSSPKDVPVDPSKIKTWKPPPGFIVINPPTATGSKTTSNTINRPGSRTKYNRAVSYLKQTGYSDAEARAALKQYQP